MRLWFNACENSEGCLVELTQAHELEKRKAEELAEKMRRQEERSAAQHRPSNAKAKWGTKEAKRMEIERLQREIEERKRR